MPIDPQLKGLMAMMDKTGVPKVGSVPAATLRAVFAGMKFPPSTEVAVLRDLQIPCGGHILPARLYRSAAASVGLIVYFHGGGWVLGDLQSSDEALRMLANATDCAIVSVDYRLAPEHPFPAGADDAMAATHWVARNAVEMAGAGDVPLVVMGDSSGANFAAVVAQLARDRSGPAIALQVLIYPVTEGDMDSVSMHAFEPPVLGRLELAWFADQYIPADCRHDARYAPGRASSLAGLPPAIILVAEHDLLAAEGEMYAVKLRDAGVHVDMLRYEGAIHGFFTMAATLDIGRRAINDVARHIRGTLQAD